MARKAAINVASTPRDIEPGVAEVVASWPHAYTLFFDGEPVACAGIKDEWPGRGTAWVFLIDDIKPAMIHVALAIRGFLEVAPYHRIEAAVDVDFEPGHRLVRALGFAAEGIVRQYCMDRRDHVLYAKVK